MYVVAHIHKHISNQGQQVGTDMLCPKLAFKKTKLKLILLQSKGRLKLHMNAVSLDSFIVTFSCICYAKRYLNASSIVYWYIQFNSIQFNFIHVPQYPQQTRPYRPGNKSNKILHFTFCSRH
jgi:hypothetical protein